MPNMLNQLSLKRFSGLLVSERIWIGLSQNRENLPVRRRLMRNAVRPRRRSCVRDEMLLLQLSSCKKGIAQARHSRLWNVAWSVLVLLKLHWCCSMAVGIIGDMDGLFI